MEKTLKRIEDPITESLIRSLIGKTICFSKEMSRTTVNKENRLKEWFSGIVSGYEKIVIGFDSDSEEFFSNPKVFFYVLLTDGRGYLLSNEKIEVVEIIRKNIL